MRNKVFQVIRGTNQETSLSRYFDIFITSLIIANVVAIVLESYADILDRYRTFFMWFEILSVVVFTAEYLSRIITADLLYPDKNKFAAILKFIFSPFGMIDLLAIIPFYLPFFIAIDLRFIRAMRLIRLLRILKLGRYMKSMQLIGQVLKDTAAELGITVFVCVIMIVLASALMFNIEKDAQPDKFNNIGSSVWWAIATLTTVGYGDIYPVTGWGRLVSGIIAILGIGLIALPTGIISSAFMQKMKESKEEKLAAKKLKTHSTYQYCPHCGKKLDP